jgi:hypothetical protein
MQFTAATLTDFAAKLFKTGHVLLTGLARQPLRHIIQRLFGVNCHRRHRAKFRSRHEPNTPALLPLQMPAQRIYQDCELVAVTRNHSQLHPSREDLSTEDLQLSMTESQRYERIGAD